MPTFIKRGPYQYQVKIRRRGYPPISRTFESKEEAETFAYQIESEIKRGIFVSRKEAENTTLFEALDRYEREISCGKKGYHQESMKIRTLKRHPIVNRFLATIQGKDIAEYRDERLKEAAPNTVRHELAVLSHVFTIAVKEWGMSGLINPVSQIRMPKSPPGRDRRVKPGEIERIINATQSSILPEIVLIAMETGMRQAEIAGIAWDMVDLKKRTVTLMETKNGEKRIVPLSTEAVRVLSSLTIRIDGKVWEMFSPQLIAVAFRRAVSKARFTYEKECQEKGEKPDPSFLADLTFHDLRHEATSRFFEKGFNPMEVSAITGHKTLQMLKRYTHLKAEDLAERLQ